MVIVGVVLLLPGLCALVFGAGSLFSSSYARRSAVSGVNCFAQNCPGNA